MSRLIKGLLIFEVGIILAIFFFGYRQISKTLPVSSSLPDLIFPQKKSSTLTLVFSGDVMLGRSVNTRINKYTDPTWPFLKVASTLSQADLTVINLESPFFQGCKSTDTGMVFCSDPRNVVGLKLSGVDYATIANNHINNYGEEGKEQTISILSSNGITPIVQGKTKFITLKNSRIVLLTFCDLPQIENNIVKNQIADATQSADLTIVTFHWGNEYQKQPSARQIELAHLAINSGADIVVGHHPHVTQTEETYQGKPIFYSLGNLVFDQMWSQETRLGQILRVTYQDNQLIKKELLPIEIFDYGQPAMVTN